MWSHPPTSQTANESKSVLDHFCPIFKAGWPLRLPGKVSMDDLDSFLPSPFLGVTGHFPRLCAPHPLLLFSGALVNQMAWLPGVLMPNEECTGRFPGAVQLSFQKRGRSHWKVLRISKNDISTFRYIWCDTYLAWKDACWRQCLHSLHIHTNTPFCHACNL